MKRYFFAAILFTLIAIPVIWKIQQNQDRMIIEHHLLAEDFAKNHGTPPGVAISTVFFGPFRNLMVNALWLRMDRLHKQGKYFEMVQLADWILQVQPENATAAQYVAWNMAYNITVTQQDFDTRRRWIRKAVETLHKAIAKNPNEPILYREMGWIWQHKLGDELDQASPYYKQKIAEENYRIFGKKHAPDWQRLTELPADWKSLYQKYPALRSVCS
ncbi:MAG: hypothetical protein J6Q65_05420, partial [Lentisphaeria bacterium]|nr:hypothetical protein [Lentisphaeria bacterium]